MGGRAGSRVESRPIGSQIRVSVGSREANGSERGNLARWKRWGWVGVAGQGRTNALCGLGAALARAAPGPPPPHPQHAAGAAVLGNEGWEVGR